MVSGRPLRRAGVLESEKGYSIVRLRIGASHWGVYPLRGRLAAALSKTSYWKEGSVPQQRKGMGELGRKAEDGMAQAVARGEQENKHLRSNEPQ